MKDAVIFGVHPVREALRAQRKINLLYVARGDAGPTRDLVAEARAQGVRVATATRRELDRMAGAEGHQGVLAYLAKGEALAEASVADILAIAEERREKPLVLVLDGVQDPHNLGALIRSAYALGAHGVVVPKDRAAKVTAAVERAAAGATSHVAIATVTNVKHALTELREAEVWLAAAVMGGKPADQAPLDGALALVIGGEGEGVRPTVASACDFAVSIPIVESFDSLNASVAGAILLYEAARQRRHRA